MFNIDISQSDLPIKSNLIAFAEFLELTSITEERVNELLELGWLKAAQKTENSLMFVSIDVSRVRKLERLCIDFDIPPVAAAIIVDLLERVDNLEAQVKELSKLRI